MNVFKSLLILMLLAIAVEAIAYPKNPTTKGSLCTKEDPHFLELRYAEKIPYCKRAVSESKRKKVYAAYGIKWEDREHYTIDHLIPLSIGGSNKMDNLWPEHLYLKCRRGTLEFNLYKEMRDGKIKQVDAVRIIRESKL